jgi:hypothetical protein
VTIGIAGAIVIDLFKERLGAVANLYTRFVNLLQLLSLKHEIPCCQRRLRL